MAVDEGFEAIRGVESVPRIDAQIQTTRSVRLPDEYVAGPMDGFQLQVQSPVEAVTGKSFGREPEVDQRRILALREDPQRGALGAEGFESAGNGHHGLFGDHQHRIGGRVVDGAIGIADLHGDGDLRSAEEDCPDVDVLSGEDDAVGQRRGKARSQEAVSCQKRGQRE